jgi:hypothetical protein
MENFRVIRFIDCLPLIAIYEGVTAIFMILFSRMLKDRQKGALMTFLIMSFYFFFGALHDFFLAHSIFLHRYGVILPLFLISCIFFYVALRKKNSFNRICVFLNWLFIVYIIVDMSLLGLKTAAEDVSKTSAFNYNACIACPKPDIYFLIFDEYANSRILKQVYGYDNSSLDSFLLHEGFHIQTDSRSNYQITPFSMASILNMSYLSIRDPKNVQALDFEKVMSPDRKEEAIRYLSSLGYSIINNSTFDLPGSPSSFDQPFIVTRTKLITHRTLVDYMARDIGTTLKRWLKGNSAVLDDWMQRVKEINYTMVERTIRDSEQPSRGPLFVYMHVYMPHDPHLYDTQLRLRNFKDVDRGNARDWVNEYLNYLPYTNEKVKQVVSAIKKNTEGHAVILFMSDHGMRDSLRPYSFNNQAAIYLPDRDYRTFSDSLTAVNEFRVLFNKLYQAGLPLLKDSTTLLSDKQGLGSE